MTERILTQPESRSENTTDLEYNTGGYLTHSKRPNHVYYFILLSPKSYNYSLPEGVDNGTPFYKVENPALREKTIRECRFDEQEN